MKQYEIIQRSFWDITTDRNDIVSPDLPYSFLNEVYKATWQKLRGKFEFNDKFRLCTCVQREIQK